MESWQWGLESVIEDRRREFESATVKWMVT